MSDVFDELTGADFLPVPDDAVAPEEQLRAVETDIARYPTEAQLTVGFDAPPIGRGWAFDPVRKSFIFGSRGQGIMRTDGIATLKIWIYKCMHTKRGVHPIYSDDFGMRDPFGLIGGPMHEMAIGEYESMLSEALTYHPRIAGIQNYRAQHTKRGDGLSVAFDVVLDDQTVIPIDELLPI